LPNSCCVFSGLRVSAHTLKPRCAAHRAHGGRAWGTGLVASSPRAAAVLQCAGGSLLPVGRAAGRVHTTTPVQRAFAPTHTRTHAHTHTHPQGHTSRSFAVASCPTPPVAPTTSTVSFPGSWCVYVGMCVVKTPPSSNKQQHHKCVPCAATSEAQCEGGVPRTGWRVCRTAQLTTTPQTTLSCALLLLAALGTHRAPLCCWLAAACCVRVRHAEEACILSGGARACVRVRACVRARVCVC
jgi:hypothetical protein